MKITKKSEDLSAWYNDIIREAKIADHGPVKGTMIIRPYGFSLWEAIQKNMDPQIKDLGAENAYFPLFIPYSFLQKEKTHVEGFSPELAVVTHGGGEELSEPVVVRPTSETIMYDSFSKWIQSYKDLPLAINQWNNVVRWEKRPYLFLRTTEFLWQEGHTAHATQEDAQKMQKDAMEMYVNFYQKYLGIYGYAGKKSESEKFAGADSTFTYEILIPDGKVLQGCTSHDLGQNFAKAFKVEYQNKEGKMENVWQTSWGFTTRSVGALILVHGDDNGLVLPPQITPLELVIIPIITKSADNQKTNELAKKAFDLLKSHDLRVKLDESDQSPGWKFNQYELQGVPLRIEIGASEALKEEFTLVRRDTKDRLTVKLDKLQEEVTKTLEQIQQSLLEASRKLTHDNTREAKTYDQFKEIMNTTRGFIEAFWCENKDCETKIKEETKATTRCLPFEAIKADGKCVHCQKPANYRWIFGQAY